MENVVGYRIRKYRQERYMEVDELASAVDLHPQTIYDYEGGRRKVSRKSIKKIAKVLKVEISDLTG